MLEIIKKMTSMDWIIYVCTVLCYLCLVIGIIKNKGKGQNFYTWVLWFILDIILLTTTYDEKGKSIVMIFPCLLGSFSISLLLIKKRVWTKEELVTSILIFITVVVWLSVSDLYGIIFAVISQLIAGWPLTKECYKHPEPGWTLIGYVLFIISCILMIFQDSELGLWDKLFPIALGLQTVVDIIPLIWKLLKKDY